MANPEHLKILKQGVKAWNKWRRENPRIKPNLSNVVLCEADICGSNLSGADLEPIIAKTAAYVFFKSTF